jgi:ribosome maturation factor RimP
LAWRNNVGDFIAHFFCSQRKRAAPIEGCERAMRTDAVEAAVAALGLELVEVEHLPRGLLRVTIDHADGAPVTVDDCERVTRQLQYVFEVEAVDYDRLEVSSPGLDRLLRKPEDFVRFAGMEVDVTLRLPFQGRKKYRGVLQPRSEGEAQDRFSVLLTPAAAAADRRGGRKAAAARRVQPAAKAVAAVPGGQSGGEAVESVLNVSLAEVREVRLVPVVDFGSGRK